MYTTPDALDPSTPGERTMAAGLFAHRSQAEQAATDLRSNGFTDFDIDEVPSGHLLTVVTGSRFTEALDILERHGAETGNASPARRTGELSVSEGPVGEPVGEPVPEPTRESARTVYSARIALHGEILQVRKEKVQTGEVRIRKETITEMRTIQVPVEREELVIEQIRYPGGAIPGDQEAPPSEIRIRLMEEQIIIEKRRVVIEEVYLDKREVQQVQRVEETVRREELRVEPGPGVHPQ